MQKKKRLFIVLIAAFILISSVQVYAVVALDSDIITLIREGIEQIKSYYISESESEVDDLKAQYEKDINKFIGDSLKIT